jgi:hypothetical protein
MTKRRYSIWGREYFSDHDVELAQCDSNPEVVKAGYAEKSLKVKADKQHKPAKVAKYSNLRIVDNEASTA